VVKSDVLIIGSGIAGLAVAEKARHAKKVVILTKKGSLDGNSALAQGGVAVAMQAGDHWEAHFRDTMAAGCQMNDSKSVSLLVQKGPVYVKEWMEKGFLFDHDSGGRLLFGKEAAHEHHRILHAGGDRTGLLLMSFMLQEIKEHVKLIENETVIDLLIEQQRCTGVCTRNEAGEITYYHADHVVLATGGVGRLYDLTSNHKSLSGDGLAMAYRAGCDFKDLEFIQFHPTLLWMNGESKGLISEAVRGEGAVLKTAKGKPIMAHEHPLKDLAPRDVVARVMFAYLQKGEDLYLDISMIQQFEARFPFITQLCVKHGISISEGKIPVAPGAHFHMGGVKTSLTGKTTVANLYAVGEVACLGVHGANRLASNSLLEGLVFGSRLGEHLAKQHLVDSIADAAQPLLPVRKLKLPTEAEIQQVMRTQVGIVRKQQSLEAAKSWFESYGVGDLPMKGVQLSEEQLNIWNMLTVGWLITSAALKRTVSIGAHYLQKESG